MNRPDLAPTGSENFTGDDLLVMSLNVRSLNSKQPIISELLRFHKPDVLILSETRHHESCFLNHPGYTTHCTEPSRLGGLMILCKATLAASPVNRFGCSQLSLRVNDPQTRLFIIGAYIRTDNLTEWDSLKAEIKTIHSNYFNPAIIVAGDLNNFTLKMDNLGNKLGMHHTGQAVTRRVDWGGRTCETRLDDVWSTHSISASRVMEINISDHLLVQA